STILREAGELMTTGVMRETPLVVFLAMIIFLAALASYWGVEVIARSSEVILPVIIIFLITIWALSVPNLDLANLKPVLADGWIPVIRASLPSIVFRGELFMLIFFLPQLRDKVKANRISQWAGQIIGLLLTINVVTQIAFFGAVEVGRMVIPTMTHAESIEFFGVLERVEIILIAFWITGITMKVTIFFYVNLLLLAQLFGLKNYRSLILPTALLYFVFSVVQFENSLDLRNFIANYFFLFSLPVEFLIPLMLLIIALIRKKEENSIEKETG
ncbi:MAG TPA: endospore germination permease, partial [Clostridia bacterium]|nr:endospore germination permease [Clostridia bacterium]